jgi:hypothetical protein
MRVKGSSNTGEGEKRSSTYKRTPTIYYLQRYGEEGHHQLTFSAMNMVDWRVRNKKVECWTLPSSDKYESLNWKQSMIVLYMPSSK